VTVAPNEVKSCCAAAYGSTLARLLLGDSFHPGGRALTTKLIGSLRVGRDDVVVDVACGIGTSAVQLARQTGCRVIGVDLSPTNVREASDAADSKGIHDRVRFVVGDAEALPLGSASADGALCECALCTFPDKTTAVRELARVLRPGARLALSDVTADASRLPDELRTLQAWVACVADARPADRIAALLESEALAVESIERHDDALLKLLERFESRLRVAVMSGAVESGDLDGAPALLELARDAVKSGTVGYASLVARRA
jgi:ubiquinone/menaquinone biosynthesis C-methylase UbiE